MAISISGTVASLIIAFEVSAVRGISRLAIPPIGMTTVTSPGPHFMANPILMGTVIDKSVSIRLE